MNNKAKSTTAKFYKEPVMAEELYSGYLHKSPAQLTLTKGILTQKSWKHRFFVLYKMGEGHQLIYYSNSKKRDKPLGKIDLSKISLLFTCPEKHQMWDWIQKHFKCPSTSVLFLRVETRDYFLIGENSDDMDGWLNAIVKALKKTQNKLQNKEDTTQDNRIRSISAPVSAPEPMVEVQPDERWSAPALLLNSPPPCDEDSYYDYPRKLSEPLATAERKSSIIENKDEVDGKEEASPEDSSAYMCMASVQLALEDDQEAEDTTCIQNTSKDGQEPVCNGAINQEIDDEDERMSKDRRNSEPRQHSQPRHHSFNGSCASTDLDKEPINKSEMHEHVEKEICISQSSLINSLVLTQEEGKPCVSDCRQTQDSYLFHKGDQILAFNDLIIDTVEEIQTYLRRLSKDEVKLTIRRPPGSQPFHSEPCPSH